MLSCRVANITRVCGRRQTVAASTDVTTSQATAHSDAREGTLLVTARGARRALAVLGRGGRLRGEWQVYSTEMPGKVDSAAIQRKIAAQHHGDNVAHAAAYVVAELFTSFICHSTNQHASSAGDTRHVVMARSR